MCKGFGEGGKPSNKRGLKYLCFYIYVYVCTGQIYPFIFFLFKTHSTKTKSLTNKGNWSIHSYFSNQQKINKIWEREQDIATQCLRRKWWGNTLAHTRWCKYMPASPIRTDRQWYLKGRAEVSVNNPPPGSSFAGKRGKEEKKQKKQNLLLNIKNMDMHMNSILFICQACTIIWGRLKGFKQNGVQLHPYFWLTFKHEKQRVSRKLTFPDLDHLSYLCALVYNLW